MDVGIINNPLVSVVIPVYNTARYIREAIDSVLSQTYTHIEVIVVDDGSTDTTADILREYVSDKRVKILFQENQGPASARNHGMREAHGAFIAFLDADDVWVPEKIARQLALFADQSVSVVYSDMEFFGALFRFDRYSRMAGRFYRGSITRRLLCRNFVPHSSVILRSVVLQSIGYFNEEKELFAVEDYEYYLRASLTHRFDYVDAVLARYRVHDGQISQSRHIGHMRLVRLYASLVSTAGFRSFRITIFCKYLEHRIKAFIF